VAGSGEAKPFRVLGTEANEITRTLSPDGRWLAYSSDVSGRYEVYVQSFPRGDGDLAGKLRDHLCIRFGESAVFQTSQVKGSQHTPI
jgi:WD40-like Beta Propeller Repeat